MYRRKIYPFSQQYLGLEIKRKKSFQLNFNFHRNKLLRRIASDKEMNISNSNSDGIFDDLKLFSNWLNISALIRNKDPIR